MSAKAAPANATTKAVPSSSHAGAAAFVDCCGGDELVGLVPLELRLGCEVAVVLK